jgi:hypothetical protein
MASATGSCLLFRSINVLGGSNIYYITILQLRFSFVKMDEGSKMRARPEETSHAIYYNISSTT